MAPTPSSDRPKNRQVEYEDQKSQPSGGPPRSANEPAGSEGSARNAKTATDPASGEPRSAGARPPK